MSAPSSPQSFVRSIRRSVGWNALKEYVGGALWVLPSAAGLIALAALNSTRRSTAPNPATLLRSRLIS